MLKKKGKRTAMLMRAAVMGAAVVQIMAFACAPAYANGPEDDYVPDDTDGTELQIMQPAQLEIRFGSEWAGAEFALETDAGEYPGTVPVSSDGTLRMEIGGSEAYVLRLVETPAEPSAPTTPEPTAEPTPELPEGPKSPEEESAEELPDKPVEEEAGNSPLVPIIIFGTGVVIAVGALIAMKVIGKRKERNDFDVYDENDG